MNAPHLVVFCSSEVSRPEKRDLLPGQGLIPAQESVWLTEAVFSQADLWSGSVSFILSLVRNWNNPHPPPPPPNLLYLTRPTPNPSPLPLLSTLYSPPLLPLSSRKLGCWRKRNSLNKDSLGKCPKLATWPYVDMYGEIIFKNSAC